MQKPQQFGVVHDEVVVIETTHGRHTHITPHSNRGTIEGNLRDPRHGIVHIEDQQGQHSYPSRAILGVHYRHAVNYAQARVQLWQDRYGTDTGNLYLIDPGALTAWRIREAVLAGTTDFHQLAADLVDGTKTLDRVAEPVPVTELHADPGYDCAATWHHKGATVELHTGTPAGADGPQFVAGPRTRAFIGDDDMRTAEDHTQATTAP